MCKKSSKQKFSYGASNVYMMKCNAQSSTIIFCKLYKDHEDEKEKYRNNTKEQQEKCKFVRTWKKVLFVQNYICYIEWCKLARSLDVPSIMMHGVCSFVAKLNDEWNLPWIYEVCMDSHIEQKEVELTSWCF